MPTKITKRMHTETAHRLEGHPGRCQFIHGHSYLWEVSLESSQLTLGGMVEDFSRLKQVMEQVIDVNFDHALVLNQDDPLYAYLFNRKREVAMDCDDEDPFGRLHPFPGRPTAENFCLFVHNEIQKNYPSCRVSVRCWETATSYAEYSSGQGTP